jgi:predicted GTPase
MDKEKIFEIRRVLEETIIKYTDIIEDEAKSLQREHSIETIDKLHELFNKIEIENRLLQIGIVGRVKAGKSSLLNALLFNGKTVLPKAATPMTAALTILSYSEKLSAEVDFFTQKDLDDIRDNAQNYENQFNKIVTEKKEEYKKNNRFSSNIDLDEKIIRQAKRIMNEQFELSAAFDQYQRIKNSGISIRNLEEETHINAGSIEELGGKLLEFVGSDGKFMPFTKSVHIKLPQENLKDIQIIDTPGLDDPVQSREERTRELLKFCDVIFIVSPSGQFLNIEDIKLMDRITSKQGIRELAVVASQVDTQLMGSERNKFNGDLHKILKSITSNLGNHLSNTLLQLKESNPEILNTFDNLIEQGKEKVIHTSGVCQSLIESFDDNNNWDPNEQKVWSNLTLNYPDYFSLNDERLSKRNLELLANISATEEIIKNVQLQKDKILQEKRENLISSKFNSLIKYKESLINYATHQEDRIKNSNIKEIQEKKKSLEKIQKKASVSLNEEYYDLVKSLEINIKNDLVKTLKSYFKDTVEKVNESESSTSEEYTVDKGSGFFWWRSWTGNRYKTETRTVTSVRTGAVKSAIENLKSEIEDAVSIQSKEYMLEWKKSIYTQLLKILRSDIDDDDLEPQIIRSTIRNVLNNIEEPNIEYEKKLPASLNAKGVLTSSKAEEYLEAAHEYLANLKTIINTNINDYLKKLENALNGIDPSAKIFGGYTEKIAQLEEQLKTREIYLERFNKFIQELKGIS